MSEYQYYEFQAIDQPLDERAQRDLRDISSRATITATSFTNTYSWGDLRGDPAQMLAHWFDASLHVANWGTRWLAFRAPRAGLSSDDLAPYTRKPKSYDEAVDLVTDLRDLVVQAGERTTWDARLSALRTAHHRKPSLIQRLEKVIAPPTHAERSR